MSPTQIVQKLWNYCNVLRDDGMSYGDYVEQLTYLLFLKMADERSKPPYNQPSQIPAKYDWQSLLKKDGDDLFDHYRHILEELGKKGGLLGLIFGKAQNKFQDPAKLRRLIADLDKASLDIFWLKDESLEDSDNLPEPDILAREIVEDLQAALVQFQAIAEDLGEEVA